MRHVLAHLEPQGVELKVRRDVVPDIADAVLDVACEGPRPPFAHLVRALRWNAWSTAD